VNLLGVKKYSRKVKNIKFALIVLGGLLISSILMTPFLNPHEQRLQITYTESQDKEGKMRLLNPMLYGMDGKRQAFKIMARNGIQLHESEEVFFEDVSGEIELSRDRSKINMSAKQCIINTESSQMDLLNDVRLKSSNSYTAKTEKAYVSLKSNDIWSDMPIEVSSNSGEIKADKFYFNSNEKILTFEGHVMTVID